MTAFARTGAALRRARLSIAVSLCGAAALGLVLVALGLTDHGGAYFVRDPAATGQLLPWAGAVSMLGLVAWGLAAGACLLAGAVARRCRHRAAAFLLATAALYLVLAVDDALQIHENVGPAHLGVPELAMYLVLGLPVLAWAIAFRSRIQESAWATLLLAAGCFAGSVVADLAERGPVVFEDWLKYSGLVALAVWSLGEAARVVTEAHVPRNGPEIS